VTPTVLKLFRIWASSLRNSSLAVEPAEIFAGGALISVPIIIWLAINRAQGGVGVLSLIGGFLGRGGGFGFEFLLPVEARRTSWPEAMVVRMRRQGDDQPVLDSCFGAA